MRSIFLAIFAVALAFTLLMAWLPHPPRIAIEESDKFWHVTAFVTLSVLASLAFPNVAPVRIGERLSFLGALIELVQNIPALHRDCDIMDWIADTAAIAVTLVIVVYVRRLLARRSSA